MRQQTVHCQNHDPLLMFTPPPVAPLQGGAIDTVSKGETVVAVPGMLGNKHLTGEGGGEMV